MTPNSIESRGARLWISTLATLLALVLAPVAFAQDDGGVAVRAVAQKSIVRPGEQVAIAVVMDHQGKFHSYPSVEQDVLPPAIAAIVDANRTTIAVKGKPAWIERLAGVQWPTPHESRVADPEGGEKPISIKAYSGRAIAFVRVEIAQNAAPGTYTLEIDAHYQACDEKSCLFPQDVTLSVPIEVTLDSSKTATPNEPDLFKDFDLSAWGKGGSGGGTAAIAKPKPIEFNVFGLIKFKLDPSGPVGLALLLALAALGGLLLNFTPCVLPVIPIKILSLSAAAGNPRRCLYLGIVMFCGVVFFWLLIGGAMAFVTGFKSISTLFQNPWFPLGVGLFMLVMSAGMFNAFAVRLPQWIYMVNPQHETTGGSFMFGILTAVLSTPCTAPFMGAAAAWAAFQKPVVTMSAFAAIGVGMALPYLLLSANPKWIAKMPRTGLGSELVKHVMGLLMIAVAAYFIGLPVAGWLQQPPAPPSRVYWWVVAAFGVAAGLWLAWKTLRIAKTPSRRVLFVSIGLVFAAANVMLGNTLSSHGPIKWVYYTPQRFADAIGQKKVVVMDFTAEWCLTCKAMESGVLHQPQIVRLLHDTPGVVPMKVDISGYNPEGVAKLKELDWVGIPLLAVFGPGLTEPIKYDAYTAQMVREAVEKARGPGDPPLAGGVK